MQNIGVLGKYGCWGEKIKMKICGKKLKERKNWERKEGRYGIKRRKNGFFQVIRKSFLIWEKKYFLLVGGGGFVIIKITLSGTNGVSSVSIIPTYKLKTGRASKT